MASRALDVVLLAHLGAIFRNNAHHGDQWWALRDFTALFVPVWCHWNAVAGFLNRFEQRDIVFQLFFLGKILFYLLGLVYVFHIYSIVVVVKLFITCVL